MKKCKICGKELPDDAKICVNCGSVEISESSVVTDKVRIYD